MSSPLAKNFYKPEYPPSRRKKPLGSKPPGREKYHILRLCADDPENDTTAAELIDRAQRYSSAAHNSHVNTESLVAEYYIERTEQRISNALQRLELREAESSGRLGDFDWGLPTKRRKCQPGSPSQPINDQAPLCWAQKPSFRDEQRRHEGF
jgi:hypothetical protein